MQTIIAGIRLVVALWLCAASTHHAGKRPRPQIDAINADFVHNFVRKLFAAMRVDEAAFVRRSPYLRVIVLKLEVCGFIGRCTRV